MKNAAALACVLALSAVAEEPNSLTPEEKKAGWNLLFDGKTLKNWRDPAAMNPPGDSWSVDNGAIKSMRGPQLREDLVTSENFGDFELAFDWRVAPGSNSGVKYRVQDFIVLSKSTVDPSLKRFEDRANYALQKGTQRSQVKPGDDVEIYSIGFEYQVIDDSAHKDAMRGPKYQAGALYDLVPASSAQAKSAGEWNQARIVVRGGRAEHWLNGVKVVDTDLGEAAKLAAKRWGETSPVYLSLSGQKRKQCPIVLQNHNDEAWFRSLKIRRLN